MLWIWRDGLAKWIETEAERWKWKWGRMRARYKVLRKWAGGSSEINQDWLGGRKLDESLFQGNKRAKMVAGESGWEHSLPEATAAEGRGPASPPLFWLMVWLSCEARGSWSSLGRRSYTDSEMCKIWMWATERNWQNSFVGVCCGGFPILCGSSSSPCKKITGYHHKPLNYLLIHLWRLTWTLFILLLFISATWNVQSFQFLTFFFRTLKAERTDEQQFMVPTQTPVL